MRYYRDHADMQGVYQRQRERYAEELVEAQRRYPVGTFVRADTESGTFYGRVVGYTANFFGELTVDFATHYGTKTCAYLYELTAITARQYAQAVRAGR